MIKMVLSCSFNPTILFLYQTRPGLSTVSFFAYIHVQSLLVEVEPYLGY